MNTLSSHKSLVIAIRLGVHLMAASVFLYLINNYLVFWQDFPGPHALLSDIGLLATDSVEPPLSAQNQILGWLQIICYLVVLLATGWWVIRGITTLTVRDEAKRLNTCISYLIRTAFWGVLLVGIVDCIISFLRVEGFLHLLIGHELSNELGRPVFRGTYVHYTLILASFLVALCVRSISFTWLALMVVLAEFCIVLSRFIFSYEQPFMGDLVRFWYAGLFLFASAYTLLHDGHVRVDVLYAKYSVKKKSMANIIGCVLFGIPLCWVILIQGMGGRGNSINAPLLSFEISQSGYGLYIKYMMAGFLTVFAVTMLLQFLSCILSSVADIYQLPESSQSVDDAKKNPKIAIDTPTPQSS